MPPVRLLLIDDEQSILAAMAEYFSGLGYEVHCAADEGSARDLIDRHCYRIVITDLRLSRSDRFEGLALLERIRRRSPAVACIVLTAHGCAEGEVRSGRGGSVTFLQKPQPLAGVAAVVASLAGLRSASMVADRSHASATP